MLWRLTSFITFCTLAISLTSALPSSSQVSILPISVNLPSMTITSAAPAPAAPTQITSEDSETWTPRVCNDTTVINSPYFVLSLPARSGSYTWQEARKACGNFNGDFADINTNSLASAESIYNACKQKQIWVGSWQSDSYGGLAPLVYDGVSVSVSPEQSLVNNKPIIHHVMCAKRPTPTPSA